MMSASSLAFSHGCSRFGWLLACLFIYSLHFSAGAQSPGLPLSSGGCPAEGGARTRFPPRNPRAGRSSGGPARPLYNLPRPLVPTHRGRLRPGLPLRPYAICNMGIIIIIKGQMGESSSGGLLGQKQVLRGT